MRLLFDRERFSRFFTFQIAEKFKAGFKRKIRHPAQSGTLTTMKAKQIIQFRGEGRCRIKFDLQKTKGGFQVHKQFLIPLFFTMVIISLSGFVIRHVVELQIKFRSFFNWSISIS